jgi:hypothetical protein
VAFDRPALLLSLGLVGLPELRELLALRRSRSLYSRVHHRLEIAPAVRCAASTAWVAKRFSVKL